MAKVPTFRFELLEERPVFDIAPHHARMCTCYRDRAGVYHLFTDFIHESARTLASWGAEIRYYRSPDLRQWTFVDIAVPRGRWRGSVEASDLDWYGAASPNAFVSYGKVHLFYAGREHGRGPDGPRNPLRCRILVSEVAADADGAPIGPFRKQGVVLDKGGAAAWDGLRLDDPCALRVGETVHLYFKGLPREGGLETRRIGHSTSLAGRRTFIKKASPIYSVPGGGEMPRVFYRDGQAHLFLRHFSKGGGASWKHHVSDNGLDWRLHNANLFDCAGPDPGRGATDICLVRAMDGQVAEPLTALATGLEAGALKLWAYRVVSD